MLGTSFFAFILTLSSYPLKELTEGSYSEKIFYTAGWFLIANALLVGFLWLKIVFPTLLDGSIIPDKVQHYTTLIVQAFDLGLLLPTAIAAGIIANKKHLSGYLFSVIYVIFLSLLMTAPPGKILFMARAGANVIQPCLSCRPSILSQLFLRFYY